MEYEGCAKLIHTLSMLYFHWRKNGRLHHQCRSSDHQHVRLLSNAGTHPQACSLSTRCDHHTTRLSSTSRRLLSCVDSFYTNKKHLTALVATCSLCCPVSITGVSPCYALAMQCWCQYTLCLIFHCFIEMYNKVRMSYALT